MPQLFSTIHESPNLKKKLLLGVFALVAVVLLAVLIYTIGPWSNQAQAVWYSDNWKFRKKLTIDVTKVSGGSDLSNFPVLVSIADQSIGTNAQSDGDDILFTSSDGSTQLDHEIESFTPATGQLVAWVEVTTVSASANTVIYLYYGNSTSASQQDGTGTWDEGGNNNYRGVWHLKEDPSGGAPQMADSTQNNNDGTSNGSMASSSQQAGKINGSLDFTGNSDTVDMNIDMGSDASLNNMATWTYETWVNHKSSFPIDNWTWFMGKSYFANGEKYFGFNDNSNGAVRCSFNNGGAVNYNTITTDTLSPNVWYHLACACDVSQAQDCRIYINGIEASYSSTANATGVDNDAGNNFHLAQDSFHRFFYDGKLDEARVSNAVRTAGWITTSYNNQSSPSTFYTVGNEERNKQPVLFWKFDDAQGSTAQDSTPNNLDGTISGAAWQTEDLCVAGKCLYIDGTDDNVTVSDNAILDFVAADNFTISAWLRKNGTSSASNYIITKADTTNGGYKLFMDSSGDLCFEVDSDSTWGGTQYDSACTSAIDFDDDKWHYVSGVKTDTTKIELFVDGKLRASDSTIAATGTLANTNALYVGVDRDGTSNEWKGFLDEIKVYDFAKSADQIKQDYNSRNASKGTSARLGGADQNYLSDGLVGYWKMDDSGIDAEGETSTDSSGNGNNGTLYGDNSTGDNGTGMTCTDTGKFGTGCTFDGADDYVDAGNGGNGLFSNSQASSASVWVYVPSAPGAWKGIVTKNRGTSTWWGIWINDSNQWAYGTQTDSFGGSTVTVGWHHIVITQDPISVVRKIYADGVEVASRNTIIDSSNTSNLWFGAANTAGEYSNTTIDEVRLYNRALSPKEVADLYNWAPGPKGYWNFEENTGTAVNDASGNANNSTVTNATWAPGKYGAGLKFDGSGDYATRADDADFDFAAADNFTVEAWAKHNGAIATNPDYIMTKGDATNGGYQLYMDASGNFCFGVDDDGNPWGPDDTACSSGTDYSNDNKWHHLAGVKTGTTKTELFLDGVSVGSDASIAATGTLANTGALYIGIDTDGSSNSWDGWIDEPRIYNYARTQKQIVQDMNAGHPSVGSPIGSAVSHWKFNEGALNTCSAGTNDFCDSISNGNDLAFSTTSGGYTNSGKYGRAFNGTGAVWASRSDDVDFDFAAADDSSISFWFKSDSATNPSSNAEYLLTKATVTSTGAVGYAIYANTSGNIVYGIKDDTNWGASSPNTPAPDDTATSTGDIYDATWHHIVATKTGTSRIDLYVDGKLNASDTSLAAIDTLANAVSLYVADDDGDSGNAFTGDIDDLKIYRFALTAEEVKTDYNRSSSESFGALSDNSSNQPNSAANEYCVPGDSTSCAGPVGEWKMEEKTGTTVNDTSGNGKNATLNTEGTGGSYAWTIGTVGSAVDFRSVDANNNGQARIGSNAMNPLINGASAVTIIGWVNFSGLYTCCSSGNTIYATWMDDWTPGLTVLAHATLSNGLCVFARSQVSDGAQQACSSTAITLGKWMNFAYVVDYANDKIYVYIDGKLVNNPSVTFGATTYIAGTPNSFAYDAIGNGGNSWTGSNAKVDQVRVYNYARTPAQIAWDYNRGRSVMQWKLDECTGTTANDSSGNSNSGTIGIGGTGDYTSAGTCTSGTATEAWNAGATGKLNSSLGFDGADDNITRADDADLDFAAAEDFSVSAWVKHDGAISTNPDYIVSKHDVTDDTEDGGYKLWMDDSGDLCFGIDDDITWDPDDSACTSGIDFDDSNWHHVVGIKTGTTKIDLYIDGKFRATDASILANGTMANSNAFYAGVDRDGSSNEWDGQLDDIQVFRYALTATQVKLLHNNGALTFAPSTGAP